MSDPSDALTFGPDGMLEINREAPLGTTAADIDILDVSGQVIQEITVQIQLLPGRTAIVDFSQAVVTFPDATTPAGNNPTPNAPPPADAIFTGLVVTPNPARLDFLTPGASSALNLTGQFNTGNVLFSPSDVALNGTFSNGNDDVFTTDANGVVSAQPPGPNNPDVSTNSLTISYNLNGVMQQATIEVRTGLIVSTAGFPTVVNPGSSSPTVDVDFFDGNFNAIDITNDPNLAFGIQPSGQGVSVDNAGSVTVEPGTAAGNFTLVTTFDFEMTTFREETPVIVP